MKNEMNFSQKMESLKNDLVRTWKNANEKNEFVGTEVCSWNWVFSIDPENFVFFKTLLLSRHSHYTSLNSFAHSLRQGKQLIGLN